MPYYIGFILAVLAVPGVYYIFTLFLSAFSPRKTYRIAIEGDGKETEALIMEIREAERFLETKTEFSQKPLVVFKKPPSEALAQMLAENCIIYSIIIS